MFNDHNRGIHPGRIFISSIAHPLCVCVSKFVLYNEKHLGINNYIASFLFSVHWLEQYFCSFIKSSILLHNIHTKIEIISLLTFLYCTLLCPFHFNKIAAIINHCFQKWREQCSAMI